MTKWDVPEDAGQQAERKPHPPGVYDAVVVGAKATLSKSEKPQLRLEFKTGEGKLTSFLTYTASSQKARWAFFSQLANMGVGKEFLAAEPEMDDIALEVLKARCMITVEHREYEGKVRDSVRWIDGAPSTQLPSTPPVAPSEANSGAVATEGPESKPEAVETDPAVEPF